MDEKGYKNDQDQLKMLVTDTSRLNDNLKKIENQLFTLEAQYLQEECPSWNIIRGFDSFNERLSSISRRTIVTRDDRIFSLSSHSSPAINLPMDDDIRSIMSEESIHSHKSKRYRKKKSLYGEDDYE